MTEPAKKEPKPVLVECKINNIWTSQGRIRFGDSIMLEADEAKFVKARQQELLKRKMEA